MKCLQNMSSKLSNSSLDTTCCCFINIIIFSYYVCRVIFVTIEFGLHNLTKFCNRYSVNKVQYVTRHKIGKRVQKS